MQFCPDCEYMLYIQSRPVDDTEDEYVTQHICKNCGFSKDIGELSLLVSDTNTAYDTNIKLAPYLQDNIVHDPTIPHVNDIECPFKECTKPTAAENDVMYMKYDYSNMKYVYKCCYCKKSWK